MFEENENDITCKNKTKINKLYENSIIESNKLLDEFYESSKQFSIKNDILFEKINEFLNNYNKELINNNDDFRKNHKLI